MLRGSLFGSHNHSSQCSEYLFTLKAYNNVPEVEHSAGGYELEVTM